MFHPRSAVAAASLILLFLTPLPLHASTIRVPADQPTIQAGIDAAVDGDTVLVADGIYKENIDFLGKAITVESSAGPETTIVVGNIGSQVVRFTSGEGNDSILKGFTLTNGWGDHSGGDYGGGVFCDNSSPVITGNIITGNWAMMGAGIASIGGGSPQITENRITGNYTEWVGGGIYIGESEAGIISRNVISDNVAGSYGGGGMFCFDSSLLIEGNLIAGNEARPDEVGSGAGIWMQQCTATIADNLFLDNITENSGGGILIQHYSSITIFNNLFANNVADDGGAICLDNYCSATIRNCTFTGNAEDGQGGAALACYYGTDATLTDSIIWGNHSGDPWSMILLTGTSHPSAVTVSHCLLEGGEDSVELTGNCTLNWGPGMIDADPLFTPRPGSDYYLGQTSAGQQMDSPCLDAGSDLAENICFESAGDTRCLDLLTTRTDQVPDAGQVDLGFHSTPSFLGSRLVTGPGPSVENPPQVNVFLPLQDATAVSQFSAYGADAWGVNVGCGRIVDTENDSIITGPGPGEIYGPHVRGFQSDGTPLPGVSFLAYGTNRYGVNVAAGDLDGDGIDELLTAPGPSLAFASHVRGWNVDGGTAVPLDGCSFFAWSPTLPRFGAQIASGIDLDGDNRHEIVVGAGPDPSIGSPIRVFEYRDSIVSLNFSLEAYPSGWTHGVTVAVGSLP